MNPEVDPRYDLVLDREVDVPVHLVWKAWTTPELMKQWFTPRPWTTPIVELDLRRGGKFRTVMAGPEGESFDGSGCILDFEENARLVWTSVMGPGYRPQHAEDGGFAFTAHLTFTATEKGTRYVAHVMHDTEAARVKHEEMGFHGGWGTALDQLVEAVRGLA